MANVKNLGKANGKLVMDLDAAIALLTRVRLIAISSGASIATAKKSPKQPSALKQAKRVMSATAREAIAAAQRKRWAKVRRQKKQIARHRSGLMNL